MMDFSDYVEIAELSRRTGIPEQRLWEIIKLAKHRPPPKKNYKLIDYLDFKKLSLESGVPEEKLREYIAFRKAGFRGMPAVAKILWQWLVLATIVFLFDWIDPRPNSSIGENALVSLLTSALVISLFAIAKFLIRSLRGDKKAS